MVPWNIFDFGVDNDNNDNNSNDERNGKNDIDEGDKDIIINNDDICQ